MSWTLCTSGSAILKAGVNVNSTITDYGANKTYLDQLSDEAESAACTLARYDVITNYSDLTTNGKSVLAKFTSAHIAQNLINYDPDAIGTGTGTFQLNVLENEKSEVETFLKDDKNRKYLGMEAGT